jgi:hypothetical protein
VVAWIGLLAVADEQTQSEFFASAIDALIRLPSGPVAAVVRETLRRFQLRIPRGYL